MQRVHRRLGRFFEATHIFYFYFDMNNCFIYAWRSRPYLGTAVDHLLTPTLRALSLPFLCPNN